MDNYVKGGLIIALLISIYHFYYAHIIKGNTPPELVILIIVLAVVNYLIFSGKVKLKD